MKYSLIATNLLYKVDINNKFSIGFALNEAINRFYINQIKG